MDRINALMKQVSVFWNESYLGVDLGVSISVGSILAFSWLLRRKVPQLLLWIIGRIFGANRRPVLHDLLEAIRSPLEITMLVIGLLLALHVAGLDSLQGGSVHLVLRSCVILIVFWTLVRMVGPTLTHSLGEDSQTGQEAILREFVEKALAPRLPADPILDDINAELARMAYEFAKGGIDIIKDDHGLADQPYSRYDERVRACAKAVARANQETGRRCVYAPCVCAPAHLVISRAHAARAAGAGAVLMIPGITGMDTMRELAADVSFGLPIICHPAMLGAMLGGGSKSRVGGFSHEVLLGVLPRLAGADMTIFPSFGGRFGFSVDECKGILHGSRRAMGTFPEIFPTPGGGMTMERVAKMVETFGADICLLIGGSLMGHSPDLVSNAKHFMGIAGRKDLWGPKEQISGH